MDIGKHDSIRSVVLTRRQNNLNRIIMSKYLEWSVKQKDSEGTDLKGKKESSNLNRIIKVTHSILYIHFENNFNKNLCTMSCLTG